MRALLQRVSHASVSIDGRQTAKTGPGLLVLLGISKDDTQEDAAYLVEKTVNLRIFADDESRFNKSALDVGAEFLVVSQFTLYADTRKGRRPDFNQAAAPEPAEGLYAYVVELFRSRGLKVETGRFGEYMQVELVNDGPVTIMLDSTDRNRPRRA